MDEAQYKRLGEAADFFNQTFRKLLVTERGIQAETIIASASRMAGTMLFRSFNFAGKFEPGTPVLSSEANEFGPRLMHLMFAAIKAAGQAIDEAALNKDFLTTSMSQLSLRQTQERLDPMVLAYCKATSLPFKDAAFALATAAGILAYDCRPALALEKGAAIAVYGLVEGCKTAPIPLSDAPASTSSESPAAAKKPWYQF